MNVMIDLRGDTSFHQMFVPRPVSRVNFQNLPSAASFSHAPDEGPVALYSSQHNRMNMFQYIAYEQLALLDKGQYLRFT